MIKVIPDAWLPDFRKWADKTKLSSGSYYKAYLDYRMGE